MQWSDPDDDDSQDYSDHAKWLTFCLVVSLLLIIILAWFS